MTRRSLLKWLSSVLSGACAALIVLPGVRYVLATVRRQGSTERPIQRVARFQDLPPGKPVEAAITGRRRDAWSIHPEEVIGRVWLIRRTGPEVSPEQSRVDAFTGVCPHLRCAVQLDSSKKHFVCPCHKGAFDFQGKQLSQQQLGHKNPAPRGLDALHCRIVADENDDWWVEVAWQDFEPGIAEQVAMS